MYLSNWLKKRAEQAVLLGSDSETRFHIENEIYAITLEEMKAVGSRFELLGTIEVEAETYAIGALSADTPNP